MTEYDFSPGAWQRYMDNQKRVADWAARNTGPWEGGDFSGVVGTFSHSSRSGSSTSGYSISSSSHSHRSSRGSSPRSRSNRHQPSSSLTRSSRSSNSYMVYPDPSSPFTVVHRDKVNPTVVPINNGGYLIFPPANGRMRMVNLNPSYTVTPLPYYSR